MVLKIGTGNLQRYINIKLGHKYLWLIFYNVPIWQWGELYSEGYEGSIGRRQFTEEWDESGFNK